MLCEHTHAFIRQMLDKRDFIHSRASSGALGAAQELLKLNCMICANTHALLRLRF